ncbi:hypothetical protein [Botryobacter ruber]|uniref:hypothetical protein n=1 Tax=Botryobacter ruber TaxID=2171629 RepID=UPI0013E39F32|nr:hypothetical protein [Botryobacter ruber]
MTKFYKPVLFAVLVFLVVLLMHFSRVGAIHPAHVLSLFLVFSAGLVMGALTNALEA